MNLSRRTFLQGILGLAGLLTLGLPSSAELIEVDELLLAKGGASAIAHPAGDFGSLRIDNQWYALHMAEVKPHTMLAQKQIDDAMIVMASDPVSWSVDCLVDEDRELVQRLHSVKWHEIGFMLAGYSVTGTVSLIEHRPLHVKEDLDVLNLAFAGTDKLMVLRA